MKYTTIRLRDDEKELEKSLRKIGFQIGKTKLTDVVKHMLKHYPQLLKNTSVLK